MPSLTLKKIQKWDEKQMFLSLQKLYEQGEQVQKEKNQIKIPRDYTKINRVIVSGMGGSTLGAHLVKAVYEKKLKVPVEIINNYSLPPYADKNTLSLICSYSGNTEETLSSFLDARKKKCKIVVLTTGGKLKEWKEKYNLPGYCFEARANYCNVPRLAVGYFVFSQLLIFKKLKLIKLSLAEEEQTNKIVKKYCQAFDLTKNPKNIALKTAQQMYGKIPFLTASEFLTGNLHIFNNQINENAKNFSHFFEIPEINHHLLEGLLHPPTNPQNIFFVFLQSSLYYERIFLRHRLTQKILKKQKIKFAEYLAQEKTPLAQALEIFVFGSFTSFYLAILNQLHPAPTPFVDYFKKELNKNPLF